MVVKKSHMKMRCFIFHSEPIVILLSRKPTAKTLGTGKRLHIPEQLLCIYESTFTLLFEDFFLRIEF